VKLTPFIIMLIRDNYLDYRRDKLKKLEHGVSPEMQSRMNVLGSQLATRARIDPQVLTPQNKMIVRQLKLQKASQRFDNEVKARNALTEFLLVRKGESKAHDLKGELDVLARYLVALAAPHTVTWIPGPLKKIDKAMGKTIEDYDYAWSQNKDLVRGTLRARMPHERGFGRSRRSGEADLRTGPWDVRDQARPPAVDPRQGGTMSSGYSGWNFVVQFKDHTMFGAEVQANTFDLLYGKHSRAEVLEFMRLSPPEYSALQSRLNFPGGLGHALYDIQDIGRSKCTKAEGDWARQLALDYNDACRGDFTAGRQHADDRECQGAVAPWGGRQRVDLSNRALTRRHMHHPRIP
jgi:hypothetical protein